jgi:nucleoid DNA-binding protein
VTLTKNRMVSEIGRRTRLKNRDVQAMLEALVEVWTEELVNGGRIELEDFMVLEVVVVAQPDTSQLKRIRATPRLGYRRVRLRTSKYLKRRLNSELLLGD